MLWLLLFHSYCTHLLEIWWDFFYVCSHRSDWFFYLFIQFLFPKLLFSKLFFLFFLLPFFLLPPSLFSLFSVSDFSLSFSLSSPFLPFSLLLSLFFYDNKERQTPFSIGYFEPYYLGTLSNIFIPSTFSSIYKLLNIASIKYNNSH